MSVISASRWIAISQAVRIAGQLGGMALLARLLSPGDYGLMAMVTAVVTLSMLLRDLGTSAAIIQKADLDEDTTCAVFWLNIAMGVGLCVVTALASPLAAWVLAAPPLAALLIVASLVFPLSAVGSVHQALLERRSQFKTLARIEIVSTISALALAVSLARFGAGVYSLVAQMMAAAIISAAQLFVASGWRPTRAVKWQHLRRLVGFSGNLVGFSLINYVARNADTFMIGRFIGASGLGAYSLAYKLMLFPLHNLTFVLTRALYPVMSRQQDDIPAMRVLYLRSISALSLLTAPLMGVAAILREPIVTLLFGPQWDASADVLMWLAPTGFIQSMVSTVGTVFMARGRTDLLLKLGIVGATLYVVAFAAGLSFGIVGVAAFYFAANVVYAWPCFFFAGRMVDCSAAVILYRMVLPVGVTVVVCGCLLIVLYWIPQASRQTWPVLVLLALGAGAMYFGSILLIARRRLDDVIRMLRPSAGS